MRLRLQLPPYSYSCLAGLPKLNLGRQRASVSDAEVIGCDAARQERTLRPVDKNIRLSWLQMMTRCRPVLVRV